MTPGTFRPVRVRHNTARAAELDRRLLRPFNFVSSFAYDDSLMILAWLASGTRPIVDAESARSVRHDGR